VDITFSTSVQEKLRYDMDEGRLITESYPDGVVRQAIEIRKGLEDALVLEAVVIELRRRGYTVIAPEGA
jgi:hypothetical protein